MTTKMFEDRTYKRTFYSAPQSVPSLVAALLEPSLTVLAFIVITQAYGERISRPALTLCVLVFALTFPGRNRFGDNLLAAFVDIVTSWVTLIGILALSAYATRSLHYFEHDVLLTWMAITPVLQWFAVWVGKVVVTNYAKRPTVRRSAVVVGAGPLGAKLARAWATHDDQGIDFVGYFDDRTGERVEPKAAANRLGGLKDVARCVSSRRIREVYITLPLSSQPRIVELLGQLQDTTASLFFVPDVFGISIIQGRLQDMNGVPVVGICETPFTGTNGLIKRLSDLVIASFILLVVSPLLLAIAVGVWMSSPGPVIFRQRRNGLDGSEIIVYKFRTMTWHEEEGSVRQARKADPRITRFGAFLRHTSLDELPQFVNVLQGRMSIVGPRPHAVAHTEEYRHLIKAYMVRHKVRPGITGWAQINGHRGETDTVEKMQARVECDLEYLRNWSLGLDLQIIVRTIRLVFFDRHAY